MVSLPPLLFSNLKSLLVKVCKQLLLPEWMMPLDSAIFSGSDIVSSCSYESPVSIKTALLWAMGPSSKDLLSAGCTIYWVEVILFPDNCSSSLLLGDCLRVAVRSHAPSWIAMALVYSMEERVSWVNMEGYCLTQSISTRVVLRSGRSRLFSSFLFSTIRPTVVLSLPSTVFLIW